MAGTRSLPPRDRHVHMSRVREHLQRATKHAAVIHGREVVLHPELPAPPDRSAPPSSPQPSRTGGGGASSTR